MSFATTPLTKIPQNSELMFSAKEIDLLVDKLAKEIGASLRKINNQTEGGIVFIGILKGSWMFMADLVRKIDYPLQIDFLRASSYGQSKESSGAVKFEALTNLKLKERDVFLIDEIIDTGRTLKEIKAELLRQGARSVNLVALLDKKSRRQVDIEADFVGVEIPDAFVIGYGLDWSERYRDLPEIRSIV